MTEELKSIEEKILKYLEEKTNIDEIDTSLVSELLFNIELIEKCKEEMRTNGFILNASVRRNARPTYYRSQYFNAYQQCLKNINTILTSLALTPRERQKFKLAIEEGDRFDEIMNA